MKWVLLAGFLLLALLTALISFDRVRRLVLTWDITDLAGIPVRTPPVNTAGTLPIPAQADATLLPGTPAPTPASYAPAIVLPTPDPWDGESRVTILVMGLDYADWENTDRIGPPRSDTMILLTVDPVSRTAGMLFIPRDLWVTMPGIEGRHKINTAYRFGELYQMPGGGPGRRCARSSSCSSADQLHAVLDFTSLKISLTSWAGSD
jgi:hypothetical protein